MKDLFDNISKLDTISFGLASVAYSLYQSKHGSSLSGRGVSDKDEDLYRSESFEHSIEFLFQYLFELRDGLDALHSAACSNYVLGRFVQED